MRTVKGTVFSTRLRVKVQTGQLTCPLKPASDLVHTSDGGDGGNAYLLERTTPVHLTNQSLHVHF